MRLGGVYETRGDSLIDIFQITDEEQKKLKTIISASEKNSRRAKKRLDSGMKPQNESEAKNQPWLTLGISRRTYYTKKKKGLI